MREGSIFFTDGQQNDDSVSGDEVEAVELADVFAAAGGEVAPGGLYAGVAEDVGEAHDVVAVGVEDGGEEVAQVVGKDFAGVDMGGAGEGFHLAPDLLTADGTIAGGAEEGTAGDLLRAGIALEFVAQAARQEDDADFAFEVDLGAAVLHGLGGDVAEFADAEAAGGDGLEDEGEALLALAASGAHEGEVVALGEFAAGRAEELALHAQVADAAVAAPEEAAVAVDGGEHGVDADGGVALAGEGLAPGGEVGLVEGRGTEPAGEGAQVAAVFVDGGGAALFAREMPGEGSEPVLGDGLGHGWVLLLAVLL